LFGSSVEDEPVPVGAGRGPAARATPASSAKQPATHKISRPAPGRARDLNYDEALAMLSEEDGGPIDDRSGLDPVDDVPEIRPLDQGEALAILGQDDPRKGKPGSKNNKAGGPPKKNQRSSSSASRLVPLSASDEDFGFLEDSRGKNAKPSKRTDPFARARR